MTEKLQQMNAFRLSAIDRRLTELDELYADLKRVLKDTGLPLELRDHLESGLKHLAMLIDSLSLLAEAPCSDAIYHVTLALCQVENPYATALH